MTWIERLNQQAAGRIPVGNGLSVEVLHWAYHPHLPDNVLHRHTYFEVCLVGQWGSGQFRVGQGAGQTVLPIKPGNVFIARPGVVHQITNTSGPDNSETCPNMELSWLSFYTPLLSGSKAHEIGERFAAFGQSADVLVVSAEKAVGVAAIWNALRVTSSADEGNADAAQTVALTAALLLGIAQAGGEIVGAKPALPALTAKNDADRLTHRAVQFIHQHLSRPISVPEIADYLSVSPRHLSRLFSAGIGVGPQEYVEQARLDRARTLLLRTDDPIKQVAVLSGYADVAHFTRAFKRRFGCPPGVFRLSNGEADKARRDLQTEKPGALV